MIFLEPSDPNWVEIITCLTSLVGTVFLIWTLSEQRKITKIQQDDFRLKFLPILELTNKSTHNNTGIKRTAFVLKVTRNPITLLDWSFEHNDYVEFIESNEKPNYTSQIGDELTFIYDYNWDLFSPMLFTNELTLDALKTVITFSFTDYLGNKYQQLVILRDEEIKFDEIKLIGRTK